MDNNELPLNSAPASQPGAGDLQAQIDSLRSLVNTMLILLIVVSGTLNIYFWRQFRSSKADLNTISQTALPAINEYTSKGGPAIDEFLRKVVDYGKTHPDFAPIMTKYQLNQYRPPTNQPAGAVKK